MYMYFLMTNYPYISVFGYIFLLFSFVLFLCDETECVIFKKNLKKVTLMSSMLSLEVSFFFSWQNLMKVSIMVVTHPLLAAHQHNLQLLL